MYSTQNDLDARFEIKMYKLETKLKFYISAAWGLMSGLLIAHDLTFLFPLGAGYAAFVSFCLTNDILGGRQKNYIEAKKTLESKLC